jgi:hypothetical protein
MTPEGKKIIGQEALPAFILERFPEVKAKLQLFFQQNPSFQSLCADYRDCLAALQHWQQATSEDAMEVGQSYAELLQELEQEIRQFLEDERASKLKERN